jgi:lactate dehydrogenase-like 2-hydroxyacid dehydrogenase
MVNIKNCSNKIVFLDTSTLNKDVDLSCFQSFGDFKSYCYTDPEMVFERVQDANIVITNKVILNKELLERCHHLKLICIAATGMNNVDLEAAKELGIVVKNVKGYSTDSVVQQTFAMVLSLSSKIIHYCDYVRTGQWAQSKTFTHQQWPIYEIKNKKWGIIGLGQIGQAVAKVATAFGSKVSYYSTSGQNNNADYNRVELEVLLSESDIITIHAPLNDKTLNLITAKEISLLKEQAILINVGRGGIINEKDLFMSLQEKKILVGLDVVEREPMLVNSFADKLKDNQSIIITPHIAWASMEAQQTLVKGIQTNISEFLA